jgi:outer membrane protein OmpA-like peptidoglycan-associated protein
MTNLLVLIKSLVVIGTVLATPPASAQMDDATRKLIEQLKPGTGPQATRGLRPAASPPPATDAVPVAPAAGATATPPAQPTQGAASIIVTFSSGSSDLGPDARRQLQTLGNAITSGELSVFRFRIEGHTDTVGDAMANRLLSDRRAAAVRDFLIANFAVRPERLEAVGLGDAVPAVPTPPNTSEPRNRRVVVVNLGK